MGTKYVISSTVRELILLDLHQMQLKDVRIHHSMALLEPTTISLKGGQTDDLVKNQELMFINTLRHRMRQVDFLRLL